MKKFFNAKRMLTAGALFLSLSLLIGCGGTTEENSESQPGESSASGASSQQSSEVSSEADASHAVQEPESTQQSEQSAKEPASTGKEPAPISEDARRALCDLYAATQEVHPGVAGFTLQAASVAGAWLNTLGAYALSPEQVQADVTAYLSECGSDARMAFLEGWEMLQSMADALAERTEDAVAQLQDAGGTLTDKAVEASQWQSIRDAVNAALEKQS
uniref:hypothetical protein n=1 Tax=Ndongobacter massiliensis TaxID=1871025 RepID=UPI000930C429|nr:hypothetical protein [Ndongobacter massiliensis]